MTTESTAEVEGVKTYTCTVCGQTKTEVIPKKTITELGNDSDKDANNSKTPEKNQVVEDKSGTDYKVVNPSKKQVSYVAPASKTAKTVKIPSSVKINGVTYKVVSIDDNAFKNNKKLTQVTIPSTVTSIGDNAFKGCTNLKTITIPKNVTSIGSNAFNGCKKLKTIIIKTKKLTDKNVEKNAFSGLSKDTTITIPKKCEKAYKALLKKKGYRGKYKVAK